MLTPIRGIGPNPPADVTKANKKDQVRITTIRLGPLAFEASFKNGVPTPGQMP
jgi:hypothetical protein